MTAPSRKAWLDKFRKRNIRSDDPLAGNLILAALPLQERHRLLPYLEKVELPVGQILHEANQPITFAYFPNSGLISLGVTMKSGVNVEVATTGKEGFVGVPLLLGADTTLYRAVVQIGGNASRIEVTVLRRILPSCPHLELGLRRWLHAHIVEIAQGSACSSVHQIRQRLSRWLLLVSERAQFNLLPITQDALAQILGCRRSSVTAAVRHLRKAHVVSSRRGRLGILNRAALKEAGCECYDAIQRYVPKRY